MRKIGVLILGTYRSGTSALTGVMHRLGFESNYQERPIDKIFSPTGSYADNYFNSYVNVVNWEEYFALKDQYEKWCCKHHLLLQNNLCQEFYNNFPQDRERWLITTNRNIENAVSSMNSKSSGDYSRSAIDHKNICDQLYQSWDDKKIIVNFSDLINDTENTIKSLCNIMQIDYIAEAIKIVNKEISQFGE
jgi:hypothetical protein